MCIHVQAYQKPDTRDLTVPQPVRVEKGYMYGIRIVPDEGGLVVTAAGNKGRPTTVAEQG